jgi:hypothetical protein
MPENNVENSITVEIKNGEIIKPANQADNGLWQSIKNLWNGLINHPDTLANAVGGAGFEDVAGYMKLNNSFQEKLLEQQKANPDLNPLDATISAGGQVLTEYVLNEALNYNSESDFLSTSNIATFSGVRVIDNNQNSIIDIAISEINSAVAKNAAKPINEIIKSHYNNKNTTIIKDKNSIITLDQGKVIYDSGSQTLLLTEEQLVQKLIETFTFEDESNPQQSFAPKEITIKDSTTNQQTTYAIKDQNPKTPKPHQIILM